MTQYDFYLVLDRELTDPQTETLATSVPEVPPIGSH
jgi:hypothetical protein